jgi:hypothetical protein
MTTSSRNRFILYATLGYAVFGAAWIFLSDRILAGLDDVATVARLSTVKGFGFVAVTAVLLFLALRAVPAGMAETPKTPELPAKMKTKTRPWSLLIVLLLLVATISVIGLLTYRSQYDSVKQAQYHQLRAVAELKVTGITRWLGERAENANSLRRNTSVQSVLRRWLRDGRGEDRELLLYVMRARHTIYEDFTKVELFDTSGNRLLNDSPEPAGCKHRAEAIEAAVRTGEVVFLDLHRHEAEGVVHLGYLAPVVETDDDGRRVLAVFSGDLARTLPLPVYSVLAAAEHERGNASVPP